ncbi:sodium:solute symporter [Planctomycetota bacterium]
MEKLVLAWSAIGLYVLVTSYLAYRGWRRTKSLESFAVGGGDIAPWIVGLSLAAQLTSVATFVINPGLIYAYGLSGLLGFGVAAASGVIVGLIVFSKRFRRAGTSVAALSVPQWLGARYQSRAFSLGFAVLSLALLSFAVLIVVALAHVLHVLLGLPGWAMALSVIVFVYAYVLMGGVNTHAYTNAVQAVIMLAVALLLVGWAMPTLWEGEGLVKRLFAIDPVLVSLVNPKSLYFRNLFEVFFCNFAVGLALTCQPHVLSKALYLKKDSEVRTYLSVAILAGTVFVTVMFVGLAARVALPAGTKLDLVIPTYIATNFSPALQVIVTIGILCAGISTLEGILLALSTITSVDLYLGAFSNSLLKGRTESWRQRSALVVGRLSIVAFGIVTFLLARWQLENPTGGSVAIFAQYGVYALITGSFVPLASGMLIPQARRATVAAATLASVGAYIAAALLGFTHMSNNPAFLATCGILAGWTVFAVGLLLQRVSGTEALCRLSSGTSRPSAASR